MGQDGEMTAPAAVTADGARPAGLWEVPELPVAFFSFVLHFVWEFVQVPTYTGMAEMGHWEAIKLCMSATFGDVGFALTAFWTASLAVRSRDWILHPTRLPVAIFVAVGLLLTVGFEYYYTNISLRWTYSDLMPLVPPFGTWRSPLLQWMVIPPLVVWLTRRHLLGARARARYTRPMHDALRARHAHTPASLAGHSDHCRARRADHPQHADAGKGRVRHSAGVSAL